PVPIALAAFVRLRPFETSPRLMQLLQPAR
ncbi:MAG: hypothetical protein ACI8UP_005169, partial [Porticoccaceae bacterium]